MKSLAPVAFATAIALSLATYAAAQGESRPGVTIVEKKAMSPRLNDLAVASGIDNKQPDGASNSHSAGRLFCWSSLYHDGEETNVKHIWRRGDVVYSEHQKLVRKSTRWRTWSRQRVVAGEWSCEVVDANGETLGKAEFTVQ